VVKKETTDPHIETAIDTDTDTDTDTETETAPTLFLFFCFEWEIQGGTEGGGVF
jgi:hypothetical protein